MPKPFADPNAVLHASDLDDILELIHGHNYLLDGGGECVNPRDGGFLTTAAPASGSLRLVGFKGKRTEPVARALIMTSSTAAAATPTLCRMGLWLRRPDQNNYDLVASTPNDITLFAATNTPYTKAFSAPYTKLRGEEYLFGVLIVTGAALPTFVGPLVTLVANSTNQIFLPPIRCAALAGQADLPATFNASALTISGISFQGQITP